MDIFPILALDIGQKRVGLALMEQLSGSSDYKTICQRGGNKALEAILKLANEKKVKTLIAGMPLNSEGQITPQCEDVHNFCRRIEQRISLKVQFLDEFLSSKEAAEKNRNNKKHLDDLAAEIILKKFLKNQGLIPDYI